MASRHYSEISDIFFRLDEPFRSSSREADALASAGYQEPHSRDAFGFQLAFETKSSFWEYIANDDPMRGERFSRAMRAVNLNTLCAIPEMYPFDQLVDEGGVVVDVGGGLGQVGKSIISHYPNSNLKCIVQDKFANNTEGFLEAGVQMQRHDFFEPQPVEGEFPLPKPKPPFNEEVLTYNTQERQHTFFVTFSTTGPTVRV